MPTDINRDDGISINVRSGTNDARVLAVLTKHPNAAFTNAELAERTGIEEASISKTVYRLLENEPAEWHANDEHIHVTHACSDAIYHHLRSFSDATTFERLFDEDYFATDADWAQDLPDLGREPVHSRDNDTKPGESDTNW